MKNPCSELLFYICSTYFRLIWNSNPSCHHVSEYTYAELISGLKKAQWEGFYLLFGPDVFSEETRKVSMLLQAVEVFVYENHLICRLSLSFLLTAALSFKLSEIRF